MTNMKSIRPFDWCQNQLMTLNDLEWPLRTLLHKNTRLFADDRATFENNCVKTNKDRPTSSTTQSLAGTPDSGNIKLIRIISGVL